MNVCFAERHVVYSSLACETRRLLQHFLGQIDTDDLSDVRRERKCRMAGARANIEDPPLGLRSRQLDQPVQNLAIAVRCATRLQVRALTEDRLHPLLVAAFPIATPLEAEPVLLKQHGSRDPGADAGRRRDRVRMILRLDPSASAGSVV